MNTQSARLIKNKYSLSEDCYSDFIAKSNNNLSISQCMKRNSVFIFGMLIFLILILPLMTNSILGFNKIGPTPIPGNLVPFPSASNDKSHEKSNSSVHPHK